jgi:hypothetical protein
VEENEVVGEDSDDWIRKLPVDMRTLLMQIMNIEVLVCFFDVAAEYVNELLGS